MAIHPFELQILKGAIDRGEVSYNKVNQEWKTELERSGYTPPKPKQKEAVNLRANIGDFKRNEFESPAAKAKVAPVDGPQKRSIPEQLLRDVLITSDNVIKGATAGLLGPGGGLEQGISKLTGGRFQPFKPIQPENTVEKIIAGGANLGGSIAPIGAIYKPVKAMVDVSNLVKSGSRIGKLAQMAIPGAVSNAAYEGARSAFKGEPIGEIAKDTAIGGVLGGVGDVAVTGLVKGAGRGIGRLDEFLVNRKVANTELPVINAEVTTAVDNITLPASKQNGLLGEGSISAAKFTIPEKGANIGNGQKVRSLPVSAMEADYLHPDVKADLLAEIYPGGSGAYNTISNRGTMAKAKEIVTLGDNEAKRYVKENPDTALSHTVALELVKKANIEGRYDDAIELIEEVSKQSTTQGQAIQALRMWGKMTPEGMQKFYVKTIKDANKKAGKKTLNVKGEVLGEISDRMKSVSKMPDGRQKDIFTAQTLDIIASEVPPSLSKKIATIQTMAQLLNPKTAIRNIVGNFGFAGIENISDVVGTAIDMPLSLVTGRRSMVLPSIKTQNAGGIRGFKLGLEDALSGVDTSGNATKFDLPSGRVFRSGVMGFMEKALNIELRATDRAFSQAAYEESLRQQMKAARVDIPTDTMKSIAEYESLYRTFQDDNALSSGFSGIKRILNAGKDFGAGDFIVKYPKTPANLLARGIDYSPAAVFKVAAELLRASQGKGFNQRKFVQDLSRGLVGTTGLLGVGALLHRNGIITVSPPKDRDVAEMQRQSGFGDYRINLTAIKRLLLNPTENKIKKIFSGESKENPRKNDLIVSYDWFQPQSISLAIGADIDNNKGSASGVVGTIVNAFATGINAFADQPVMQGIRTAMGNRESITGGLVRVLEGVPSSFIPTIFNQVRQIVDNQRRETYSPNKTDKAFNAVKAKIPGLADNLPQKYGTLGEPLKTYPEGTNGINGAFNVFLNPAFVNRYNPTKEQQMVIDIYNETGERSHVPRVADKVIRIGKEKFELTGEEYSNYQRIIGEKTQKGFSGMSKSLKPEKAAEAMQDIIFKANMEAKQEILRARGVRTTKKGRGLTLPSSYKKQKDGY